MKLNCRNIYALGLGFFLLSLSSCTKYLDEKFDKKLVVPKSVDDLQGLFDWDYLMNRSTPGFSEASADDCFVTQDNYNTFSDSDKEIYMWDIKGSSLASDWGDSYLIIYNSNYALEQIDKVERTTQNSLKWDNVKGSALFYRGYNFLNLAWQYAKAYDIDTYETDLGIVLRMSSDINEISVRSTVKETYDQIISDFKQSANYLPSYPLHPVRPSKGASFAALARTYLSMREYDSAYKYANLALQINHELLDYNDPEVDETSFIPFKPYNQEIIFFTQQPVLYIGTYAPIASIDTLLYDSYADNDKRKTVFFQPLNRHIRFKGNYTMEENAFFTGIATDEMYLIRAECHARSERITESMDDLNTLLVKRWATGTFIPFSVSSQAEALSIILNERRKELLMRSLRWADIKRLNKEGANITPKRIINNEIYTLPPNDSRYALPIPRSIIDITGMPQN